MANWYYLISQLPSFSVTAERASLPITESAFLELCSRFLDPECLQVLAGLSLEPPRVPVLTGNDVVDAWNEMESSLRFALAQIRAQKLKKEFSSASVSVRPEAMAAARTASGMDSPLLAEQFLNEFRFDFINRLTPPEVFSTSALFVYALRLKLAVRIRKFNEEAGLASYRTIYDQILGETK